MTGTALAAPSSRARLTAAFERGDLDEAERQGELAGPALIDQLLRLGVRRVDASMIPTRGKTTDRSAVLAAIVAAPFVEDRAELLAPLADLAAGPDRRTAIPAALSAVRIARWLITAPPADDIAPDDIVTWRDRYASIAMDSSRWIELRVAALEVAAALTATPSLAPSTDNPIGVALATALKDPDPAFRAAVITALPVPVPASARAVVAALVASDPNADVALAAAAALCADTTVDPSAPVIAAIGDAGTARLKKLVEVKVPGARDAKRCLKK